MDKEYIERRALLKALSEKSRPWAHYIDAIFVAEKFPIAADVAEVKHGRWIPFLDGDSIMPERYYRCSKCGRVEEQKEPYCHCGAKMDGE